MNRKLFQYHPVFGYSFIPGLKARIDHEGGGYLVQVNQAGFRCQHEVQNAKPAGVFRILVFGDSYTAGDGVSNRDRYTDVLETFWPGVEVYNFGLSGSGTDQQYLVWREIGSKVEHDLVIIAAQVENIRRCAAQFRVTADGLGNTHVLAKPYFTVDSEEHLTLHQVPPPSEPLDPIMLTEEQRRCTDWGGRLGTKAWAQRVVNRLSPGAKTLLQRLTRYQPLPQYDRPDNPSWLLLKAILKNWVSELSKPAIILTIPLYQYVEKSSSFRNIAARFAELSDLRGAVVHNPLPDLHKHSRSERRNFRFQVDVHPTPLGHRVMAESLARCVRPFIEKT